MTAKKKRGRACWFNVYLENGKQVVSRYSFGTRISAHNTGRHHKTLYRIRVRFYLDQTVEEILETMGDRNG